jgi:hypothetical protein
MSGIRQIIDGEPSGPPKRTWCFWSTTESIQNEVPSVTAILETLIAAPLYWWVALRIGLIYPMLISVAIAPFVLLRSQESVALGIRWLLRFENPPEAGEYKNLSLWARCCLWAITVFSVATAIVATWMAIEQLLPIFESGWVKTGLITILSLIIFSAILTCLIFVTTIFFPWMYIIINKLDYLDGKTDSLSSAIIMMLLTMFCFYPGFYLAIFVLSICIRMLATLMHLGAGIKALPRNFRRLTLCTSPMQVPEIIPGIEETDSEFKFSKYLEQVKPIYYTLPFEVIPSIFMAIIGTLFYFPVWFYRFTIKSTWWFWWPLAFLGGDLRQARNPSVLRWNVTGSLWAKASIASAGAFLLWFVATNLVVNGVIFQHNPLVTPYGYLLLVHWKFIRLWQVCALVGAVLSIALVILVNDASGKFCIAEKTRDDELKAKTERYFGWIERLARLRSLFVIAFWCLVGGQATLYINSTRCWFSLTPTLHPTLHTWAQDIYGDRLPPETCPERRGPSA